MKTQVTNFNRHESMTAMERTLISITINDVEELYFDAEFETGDEGEDVYYDLKNKLYGLYDGYLYSDLKELADKLVKLAIATGNLEGNKVKAYRLAERIGVIATECGHYPKIDMEQADAINLR